MSDNIDITKQPEWICASKFRDHPHGEYLVVLKRGYITTAYFTYRNNGQILDEDGDITDSVLWFTPTRTTWFIRESVSPDSLEFLKRRISELQKEVDKGKIKINKFKREARG